jgi:hypothetical protein
MFFAPNNAVPVYHHNQQNATLSLKCVEGNVKIKIIIIIIIISVMQLATC